MDLQGFVKCPRMSERSRVTRVKNFEWLAHHCGVSKSHYITAHHLRVEAGHAYEGMDFRINWHKIENVGGLT
jgi:hypothetical protein